MFEKAVVGLDLSPAQMALLSCLPDLLRWGVRSVVLVHVVKVGYAQGAGYGHEAEYRQWLEERAGPLRDAGLSVEVEVVSSGTVADALLEIADAQGADLVVVGSRSHNMLHKVFLGSVAREVLRKSSIPVLLERLEPTEAGTAESCAAICSRSLDRVLVATDGSRHSIAAEDTAIAFAPMTIRTDYLIVVPPETSKDSDLKEGEAQHRLEALIARLESAGGHGAALLRRGDPAETIADLGQGDYTLLIVGKHGRGWAKGAVIGSTAAKVCEIARRPVLMVPGPRD
jgi:nucleotide-binding universal stress UspA family protein